MTKPNLQTIRSRCNDFLNCPTVQVASVVACVVFDAVLMVVGLLAAAALVFVAVVIFCGQVMQ